MTIFLICGQLKRYPLIKLFHLSNLAQMPNDHRMVNVEFLGNYLCSCKRINFSDPLSWSLSTSDGRSLHSSSSRLSSPVQNFLNHHFTVRWLAVTRPNALLMLLSCLHCFLTHLNSNKKTAQFCFLSNITCKV